MTSQESWDLRIDPGVLKSVKKLPRRDSEVIAGVVRLLPADPFFGDVQKMKGEDNVWRRRVGAYRLFYTLDISAKRILVFHLERRTSTTY